MANEDGKDPKMAFAFLFAFAFAFTLWYFRLRLRLQLHRSCKPPFIVLASNVDSDVFPPFDVFKSDHQNVSY